MDFTVQQIASYAAWLVFALGILAFLTALIVQAVKELPGISKAPTSLVAMAVAMVLTLVAFFAAATILEIAVLWYMVAAAVVVGFMVWYIATNGWEKFSELWQRFKKDAPAK
ncbi:ribonuclease [Clostridia bacterium OttesenSCG-928-O13]|nr:ribonuclease [Clostridia bacterium OttesenSCG-928-O13]